MATYKSDEISKLTSIRWLPLHAYICVLLMTILTYSQPLDDQLAPHVDLNHGLKNERNRENSKYSDKGYNFSRKTAMQGSIRENFGGQPAFENISNAYFSHNMNHGSSDKAASYPDPEQTYSDNANEYSDINTDSSNSQADYSNSVSDYSDFETEFLNIADYAGFEEFNLSAGDYDYYDYLNIYNEDDYNALNITATAFFNNSRDMPMSRHQFPENGQDIETLGNDETSQRIAHAVASCRIAIHMPGAHRNQLTFWENTPLHFINTNASLRVHDFTQKDIRDITNYISGPGQRCQNKDISLLFANKVACVRFGECQCYDACEKHSDCCADKAIEISLADGNIRKPLDCVSFSVHVSKHHRDISSKATDSTSMVTNCESSSPEDRDKQLCQVIDASDISQIQPVTYLASNVTYRNMYCARCNGILTDDVVTWDIKVNCKRDLFPGVYHTWSEMWSALVQKYNAGYCVIKLIPPGFGAGYLMKSCVPNLVSECHLNWTPFHHIQFYIIKDFCGTFYAPITYNCMHYKNVFCAICNGEEFSSSAQCLPRENMDESLQTFPMSVLINWDMMDDEGADYGDDGGAHDCHATEVIDPFSLSCQEVLCQARHMKVNDTCQHIYSTVSALGYKWMLTLNSHKWILLSLAPVIAKAYLIIFRDWAKQYEPSFTFSLAIYAIGNDEQKLTAIHVHINFSTLREMGITSFEENLQEFFSEAFKFKHENYSLQFNSNINTSCEVKRYDQNSYDLTGTHATLLENISDCIGVICSVDIYYIQFPHSPSLTCPFILLNASLLDIAVTDAKVIIRKSGTELEIPGYSYDLCEAELSVCIHALEHLEQNQTINIENSEFLIQSILSITCTVLSLVGLLLTFLTYCIIKRLRTIPGIIIMFIAVNLFFAQFLFQVGGISTRHVWLCRVVGILVHYFWLASFGWMTVSAYNMYSVFTNLLKSTQASRDGIGRVVCYALFANGLPFLIVFTNVLRHYLAYGEENIGYGDQICYITGGAIAKGVFFALPIGIALLINSFCFIRTVYVMHSMSHFNTALRQNRQYSLICMKLSLILGFGWILGFIASAVQTPVLWYAFIIVNGSQGLFIFIGYCINKRTLRDYRKLVGRSERNSKRGKSTRTTETVTLRSSEYITRVDTTGQVI